VKLSARFLMEFMRGLYEPIQVIAYVPGTLTARIGARSSNLMISREYALKLRHKHRFRYDHFELIQIAINEGWVVIERGNLVFVYTVEAPYFSTFALVVKREARGNEIWLKTFHRIDPAKRTRLLRDNVLVRSHVVLHAMRVEDE
jgi:hypothetical protein